MGAYDKSKDVILVTEMVCIGEQSRIEVVLAQYDGGEPKIGLTRHLGVNGDTWPRRLGRLTADEAERLIPVLKRFAEEARKRS